MNKLLLISCSCKLFFFCIISLSFSIHAIHAVAVGVSPTQLIFPENTIHLMNSNSYDISFSISGCENFSVQRNGQITAYSMLSIIVNPPLSRFEKCVLFVELESGVLSYGLAVPVLYEAEAIERTSLSATSLLTGFFVENSVQSEQNTASFTSRSLFIVLICLCFVLALFFIIRYV